MYVQKNLISLFPGPVAPQVQVYFEPRKLALLPYITLRARERAHKKNSVASSFTGGGEGGTNPEQKIWLG